VNCVKIRYPKFIVFFTFVILAFIFYKDAQRPELHALIVSLGYIGVFFSGMFYTYGFTTPFATALLLILGGELNILIAGVIAGFGALLSDLFIFQFIRKMFSDEIVLFSHEKLIKKIYKHVPKSLRKPLIYLIAGIFFASPISDELAVSFLATQNVSTKAFAVFSYISNTIGILVILSIGSLL